MGFEEDLYSYTVRLVGVYPNEKEIVSMLNSQLNDFRHENPSFSVSIKSQDTKKLISLLKGLISQQIRNIINSGVVDDFSFHSNSIQYLSFFTGKSQK